MNKLSEGGETVLDLIYNKKIQLALNTPSSDQEKVDEEKIRQAIVNFLVPYVTTISAMIETVKAIKSKQNNPLDVYSLQHYYEHN